MARVKKDHAVLPATTHTNGMNHPAFPPQPQRIIALWPVLMSRLVEGRRLSWKILLQQIFTAFSLATGTKNWCQVLVPVFSYQNLVPVSGTYVMGIRVRIVHRIFIPTPKRIQISQPATVYGYKIQYVTGWQQWTLYLCTLESIAHMTAIRQASEGSKCQDRARIWTNKLPVTYILAPVIARSSLTILRWRRRCENV